jgi:hypothetical protein
LLTLQPSDRFYILRPTNSIDGTHPDTGKCYVRAVALVELESVQPVCRDSLMSNEFVCRHRCSVTEVDYYTNKWKRTYMWNFKLVQVMDPPLLVMGPVRMWKNFKLSDTKPAVMTSKEKLALVAASLTTAAGGCLPPPAPAPEAHAAASESAADETSDAGSAGTGSATPLASRRDGTSREPEDDTDADTLGGGGNDNDGVGGNDTLAFPSSCGACS